ncbi:MAG TPA: hypothetical protein VGC54_01885 [Planctomycetota bacterium]
MTGKDRRGSTARSRMRPHWAACAAGGLLASAPVQDVLRLLNKDGEQQTEAAGGISTAMLMWGMLFGAIGVGYVMYGKKQRRVVALLCGLLLMFFPYFVHGTYPMIGVGAVLLALPFFIRV